MSTSIAGSYNMNNHFICVATYTALAGVLVKSPFFSMANGNEKTKGVKVLLCVTL